MTDNQYFDAILAAVSEAVRRLEQIGHQVEELQEAVSERFDPNRLLDVSDVAFRLKVSKRTVERIIAEGRLTPIWIEGQRRFVPKTIDLFIRASRRRK